MKALTKQFRKITGLPAILTALFVTGCQVTTETEVNKTRAAMDKPNVILIYLDDSGYGDYSHNGNPTIATPTISKIAQEGVSFSQFYTTSPACSASRYSLLTGRVPGRSGLGSWVVGPRSQRHIHTKELTIAEGLQQQGYKTGMFGKWHLGSPNKKNNMSSDTLPLAHGFEQWIGTNVSHDYVDAKLLSTTEAVGQEFIPGYVELAADLPSNQKVSDDLTKIYTDNAVDFIEQNKDQPFFAYITYNQPHLGLNLSESFNGISRRGKLGDVMAELDFSINRILAKLEESGIKDNTLIIFSSDNGPWIRFENAITEKYGDTRLEIGYALPFRDGKGSNWEGGHRVPGIFYWPGIIEGKRELAPASILDVLPTVFSLTGSKLPTDRSIDGRDISGYLIEGEQAAIKEDEDYILAYSGTKNEVTGIRQGPWKIMTSTYSQLQNNYGFDASIDTPLLFQVEQDLSEKINRASEMPDKTYHMREKLNQIQKQIDEEGTFWND